MHSVTLWSLIVKKSHIVVKNSRVTRIWQHIGQQYDEVLTLVY